jgi:hypothetical protein
MERGGGKEGKEDKCEKDMWIIEREDGREIEHDLQ